MSDFDIKIMDLTPYETANSLQMSIAQTKAVLAALVATSEDLQSGFVITHTDVMYVLDDIDGHLCHIDKLSKHITKISCAPF